MQRWIIAGFMVLAVLVGGAFFGYRTLKQNRLQPIWVPIPINAELPIPRRDEIIKELKDKLSQSALLEKVSRDLSLPTKLKLPNDQAAANELKKKLFVRAGDMDTPNGKIPSIHVGFNGKAKDHKLTGEIAMRLMDDVWPILGIEAPSKPGR